MNFMMKTLALIGVSVLFTACQDKEAQPARSKGESHSDEAPLEAVHAETRWYSSEQVREGRQLYAQYCAGCHGVNAEATADWKTPTKQGYYPPPPLNGSAHAWHHSVSVLDQVIRDGGALVGGVMPAWGHVLDEPQRLAVIASFQDYWSDEIFEMWLERDPEYRIK